MGNDIAYREIRAWITAKLKLSADVQSVRSHIPRPRSSETLQGRDVNEVCLKSTTGSFSVVSDTLKVQYSAKR